MIDPTDLQTFLNKIDGGAVAVDLLKIGQTNQQQNTSSGKGKHNGNFRVALDMEDCLDRFYGGYYSDWACGGQWNRAYQFVQLLANAFKNARVEVIAFFDGTLKKNKKLTAQHNDFRQRTNSVLKHIRIISTPPPKIWWLPPSGIRTTLRNALRSVNIQVAQTVNDHTMEIIEYFHEQKLDGILGLHPDYIIANTSRYFSSHDLRLSYKGALETKEYMVSKLLSSLSLTSDHLPFVAVFLGGYILFDAVLLKKLHERFKIDASIDFEARIRRIAEIVRNSPTNDIDEFIKHNDLAEFETQIKESVEYYQRRGKFTNKKYLGNKKRLGGGEKVTVVEPAALASETNENDETARKMMNDVNNLVDEEAQAAEKAMESDKNNKDKNIKNEKKLSPPPFVYTLPAEVLRTALNRHQRGVMDSRIYQLLTKKEIILPQILEDEQYREIPSVHIFYRPARQMIYAILFNLYHQKYLCSQHNSAGGGGNDKINKKDRKDSQGIQPPEIKVQEWIWSPQNEYKQSETVTASPLPWAVPTIQRLWFGMLLEDKQRRMKAFLTIMRSDSPLMLNRGYVPQHMLVMACVLRYIVTSPDRNILTRQELDAFLATAFSPQLPHVEYTQDLVLLGVNLRGVYLATLFMQGVETAALANDSCGVPLPWTMTNPWLFFDGKLFQLKLKMSRYVSTLRELCDERLEIVLKIQRFRKAILEDVEHFLLPSAHLDPMYRPGFLPPPTTLPVAYNNRGLPQLAAAGGANGALFYNPQASIPAPPYFSPSAALLGRNGLPNFNSTLAAANRNTNRNNNNGAAQQRTNINNNRKGYQLKVGGIVTGSWAAGGIANRPIRGPHGKRLNNRTIACLARYAVAATNNDRRAPVSVRIPRNQQGPKIPNSTLARVYGNKMNTRNRTKQKRKENRNKVKQQPVNRKDDKNNSNNTSSEPGNEENTSNNKDMIITKRNSSVELQNGTTVLASDLVNSMCAEILKEEEEVTGAEDDSTKSPVKTNDTNGSDVANVAITVSSPTKSTKTATNDESGISIKTKPENKNENSSDNAASGDATSPSTITKTAVTESVKEAPTEKTAAIISGKITQNNKIVKGKKESIGITVANNNNNNNNTTITSEIDGSNDGGTGDVEDLGHANVSVKG